MSKKKDFSARVGGWQSPFSVSSSFILFSVLLPFFLKTKMKTMLRAIQLVHLQLQGEILSAHSVMMKQKKGQWPD